ncbi:esterase-like activity of phytase family protein [Calothrix sp. 336/3]|uniref:esterase-like activity of phytase family protein n=1 Tax=Calothrix sp. 336/3 TaxID=1337936 RepID=UPI000B024C80
MLFSPSLAAETVQLLGRAILPADTFAPGATSGQLKKTNRTTPFRHSQPVQGFSSVIPGPKVGTYLVVSDNGFGAKANSPDYVLRIYAVEPDFTTGRVFPVNLQTGERLSSFNRQSFLELNDKKGLVKFPLIAEQAVYPTSNIPVSDKIQSQRLLTGGDFDIESFRRDSDGTYWLGDEFGPYLLHIGSQGELLDSPISLPNLGKIGGLNLIKSPDHPDFASLSSQEERLQAANLRGSSGFEGLAINPRGDKLYAMLEGVIKGDSLPRRLLIHEFDLASKKYTGKVFSYRLESSHHAIGELTAINDHEFIVIERDNRQGDRRQPGFANPAQFKRLYLINLQKTDHQGFVEKKLLVDLLKIADPQGIAGKDAYHGIFTFPFVTIENVLPLDAKTLLVINDNNYADSQGRSPKQSDNTEFILLRLGQSLNLDPSLYVR